MNLDWPFPFMFGGSGQFKILLDVAGAGLVWIKGLGKMKIFNYLLFCMLALPVVIASDVRADKLSEVVLGGKAIDAVADVIVVPAKPSDSEQFAAEELQKFLAEMTGQKLAIVSGPNEVKNRRWLSVGKTGLADKSGVAVDYKALGPDGIVIKTVGPNLILTGNQRGVLYACYTFLQDKLGYRWFTPDCTVYPKGRQVVVKDVDVTYRPALEYREVLFEKARNADWIARNRCNGFHRGKLGKQRGGEIYFGGAHSMAWLYMRPSEYFEKHPEYYALIKGKRVRNGQPCWSNPAVIDLVVNKVLSRGPKACKEMKWICVSQMDNRNYCRCKKCEELDKKAGSQAGSMMYAINEIARRLEKPCPNLEIATTAYQHTQKVPRDVKVRDNVMIILCSIDASFAQPLNSGRNYKFRRDLKGWAKKTNRIYIWNYQANYVSYFQPFPNIPVIAPNIRFWIENGVDGVFEEGYHGSNGGDLSELKMWLVAQLLWNPNQDTSKLVDEFLNGYYGPAGPIIREYIKLMEDEAKRTNTYLHGSFSHKEVPFLGEKVIAQADAIFARAIASVKDQPVYLKRAQVASMPALYMKIRHMSDKIRRIQKQNVSPSLRREYLAVLDKFKQYAKMDNVKAMKQYGTPHEPRNPAAWVEYMRSFVK